MVKIMETPIQIHDLGGPPLVLETPIYIYTYISPESHGGWKTNLSYWVSGTFQGRTVSTSGGGGGVRQCQTHTHMHTNYLGTFKSRHVLIFVHLTPG